MKQTLIKNEPYFGATSRELKQFASLMDITIIEKPLPLLSNGTPDKKAIKALVNELADQNTDMIYLGVDVFMNRHHRELTDAANVFHIPVFSASENAVKNGDALFAFIHRPYTVGLLAGKKALKILKKNISAYDIAVEAPERPLLVFNTKTAQKLGIFPPLSFLSSSEFY